MDANSSHSLVAESWVQQVRELQACRICGNTALEPVIDLGPQAIAGLFDTGQSEHPWDSPIPLQVVRCQPRPGYDACGFVQLRHTVPASMLYQDYGYRSGVNTTMRRHLEGLVREIETRVPLRAGDVVLDIGANDGTTLLAYRQPGLVKVAFEPSNIRPEAADHGLLYVPTLFSRREFEQWCPGRLAKVVTSIAMFYDVETPLEFCRGIHGILADDGVWVLEMSYLGAMLKHTAFDAICHEHLGYYSLQTLSRLAQEAGFVFQAISFNEANGGSVRCTMIKRSGQLSVSAAQQQRIDQALREEDRLGYDTPAPYERFRASVQRVRDDLRALLADGRRQGRRIFGYGASTKGNVLLQYCRIGPEDLIAIADRNPAKVGRRTSGSRIPICSEEEMRAARPDDLLILPWHFLEEFVERERPLRDGGTRFIVPLPRVRRV
ncbi:MAG: class I SAM-dependent methyltransferase [Candidatus Omnitrophica bacterium]|nr:class I SAM-dependent methyltransferase [Candidatus Omnitrophota bacterium]